MTARVKVTGDLFHGQVPDGAVYVSRQAPHRKRSPYASPYPVKTYWYAVKQGIFRLLIYEYGYYPVPPPAEVFWPGMEPRCLDSTWAGRHGYPSLMWPR
jgi:hypothetical protein